MNNACNVVDAVNFVTKHYADAKILANSFKVPVENILALAAHESRHGTGRIAIDNNNYFSMHAPSPFEVGQDAARGDSRIKVSKYNSFRQSGESFIARFGPAVFGKSDPTEFAQALVHRGYNSGDSAKGGRTGYAKSLVGAIQMVKIRMTQCGKL